MPGGIHHITLSPSRFGRRCRWSCKMGKSSENSFSCTASHIFLFFVFPALFDCFCVFFFLSDGFWSLTTFGGKRNSKNKKTLYGHPGCCFCSCFCSFCILSANDVPPPCYPMHLPMKKECCVYMCLFAFLFVVRYSFSASFSLFSYLYLPLEAAKVSRLTLPRWLFSCCLLFSG